MDSVVDRASQTSVSYVDAPKLIRQLKLHTPSVSSYLKIYGHHVRTSLTLAPKYPPQSFIIIIIIINASRAPS